MDVGHEDIHIAVFGNKFTLVVSYYNMKTWLHVEFGLTTYLQDHTPHFP